MARRLDAFPVLHVDGVRVDQARPVAVLQRAGEGDLVVGWPDLCTGWAEPTATVIAGPPATPVHHGPLNDVADDDPSAAVVDAVDAPVVHIDIATGTTAIVRVGRDQVLGATRHGLWTTDHSGPDPDHDHPYLGGPLPADRQEDTSVTIHHPDSTTRSVAVDRSVVAVEEADQQVRPLVDACPPDRGS